MTADKKNPISLISELCYTTYDESPTGNPIVEWWSSFIPEEGKSPIPTTSEEHGRTLVAPAQKGQDSPMLHFHLLLVSPSRCFHLTKVLPV